LALVIFAICSVGFFVWGYQYIPANNYFLFLIAGMFGLFMAFNIGGNDVANSFGTSVGAKTLTLKQALVIAAIFELSGAIFAGSEVTNTIRNEIVKFPSDLNPMKFVIIMISALLSSGLWLFYASKKGLPVSTTHSIVGGIVGAGLAIISIMLHKEWTLLLVGIIFVGETLSVILQVGSFKLTGKRIFKMSPIHHHFEMSGWKEVKIVSVFSAIGLIAGLIVAFVF